MVRPSGAAAVVGRGLRWNDPSGTGVLTPSSAPRTLTRVCASYIRRLCSYCRCATLPAQACASSPERIPTGGKLEPRARRGEAAGAAQGRRDPSRLRARRRLRPLGPRRGAGSPAARPRRGDRRRDRVLHRCDPTLEPGITLGGCQEWRLEVAERGFRRLAVRDEKILEEFSLYEQLKQARQLLASEYRGERGVFEISAPVS